MFRFVKSTRPGVWLSLPVTVAILLIPAFMQQNLPEPLVHTGEGWLYMWWKQSLSWSPVWQIAMNLPIMLALMMVLYRIDTKYQITEERSYLVPWMLVFLVLTPGFFYQSHPAYLAGLSLAGSYMTSLALYRARFPAFMIFNSSFLLATAILIYPPLIWLLPVWVLLVGLMSSPIPHQWTIFMLGIITPILLVIMAAMLAGEANYMWQDFFRWFEFRKSWPPAFIGASTYGWIWMLWILVFIVIATLRFRSQKNLARQIFLVFFFQFLAGLLAMTLMETVGVEMLFIMMIPVTFLLGNWIRQSRSGWLRDLLFSGMIGFWIWIHISSFVPDLLRLF